MLSNRSKLFLRKMKAQQGMQVPYIDPNQDQFMDYYSMQAPANIEQNLQPNFQAAQNQALRGITKTSGNMSGIQMPTQQRGTGLGNFTDALGNVQERKGSYEISEKIGEMNIPFLSNWTKSVVGAYDFFESFKDKKKQKAFEKSSQADLKVRKEQARSNSFYATPYTLGSTSDFTAKKGGTVPKKFQMGGSTQMDLFMDYYNQQQQASKDSVNQLQETYENRNKQLENEWETRKSQGFAQWQGAGAASFAEYVKYFGGGLGGAAGGAAGAMGGAGGAAASSAGSAAGGMSMQQGGYVPTVTSDSGINSTATPVFQTKQDTFLIDTGFMEPKAPIVPPSSRYPYTPPKTILTKDEIAADKRAMKARLNNKEKLEPIVGVPGHNKSLSGDRFREMQEGGEIDQMEQGMNPTEDLYSDQFQSPYEQDNEATQELENKVYSENPDVKYQNNSGLMQWLMQEEPLQTYTVSDLYTGMYGGQQQSEELPIQPVVNKLQQMGLKPSSVNTGTHNTGSLHTSGRALDLGLNTTFGGDTKKMDAFYQYLNSPEGKAEFPNIKVRDERNRPVGQKVWSGSHLHLEIQ